MSTPDLEVLHLGTDFPPVPTSDWEASIQRDLKGSAYERRLIWRTDEDITVKPYYRAEDLADFEIPILREGPPCEATEDWRPKPETIRADLLHDNGATAIQELAFALAEAVEVLTANMSGGKPPDSVAKEVTFGYAIGSNFFFEIAKLRAARLLWSKVLLSFGCQDLSTSPCIQVRTSLLNKSTLDPANNILRVATEAISAILGGCDSLAIELFALNRHLAASVQRILHEEAHLGKVSDPAAGSYYVEAITRSLALEAWKLFQQIDLLGGWNAALQSGFVEAEMARSLEAKRSAIAFRRRILIGVNSYPNLSSQGSASVSQNSPGTRLAEPLEAIRLRTTLHGKAPKVLLLKRGDVSVSNARANFCLNFLGCAGFDISEAKSYVQSDADLIVLCSSDGEYPALAQEVCSAVAVPVVIAAYPKDQILELEAAQVSGFIHIHSNLITTLSFWQDRLGMRPLEANQL